MDLISEFKKYIENEKLFNINDKLILAVSGGIDSIVLAHVLYVSKFKFSIAHCNFKLRAESSDKDEEFVKKLSEKLGVKYYPVSFDTQSYAKKNKVSIQMAARRLRYDWLNDLAVNENYNYILTAHHRDDLVETILLNMIKGTGIKGYHGILPKYNLLVRPFLFAEKADLLSYLEKHNLSYTEDASNSNIDYQRNLIRHKVVPVLKEINPSISKVLFNNARRIRIIESIYFDHIKKTKERISFTKNNFLYISKNELRDLPNNKSYLFEWLRYYGFNSIQAKNIINSLENTPGKQFFSNSHQLVIDRDYLIISYFEKQFNKSEIVFEHQDKNVKSDNINLKISELEMRDFPDLKDSKLAYLDKSLLNVQLKVRPWRAGDSFFPYGFKKRKKISDFLTDIKLSRTDKQNVYVVTSGEDIVWVSGYRIDDRFKLTDKTKEVLRMELQDIN